MRVKEVKKILGITNRSVYNYIRDGKIRYIKINKTHYDYNSEDVLKMVGEAQTHENKKTVVTYSRVSLSKQKNDLASQTKRLYDYSISNGYKLAEQYEDVESGMNFVNRKGFNALLDKVMNKEIKCVVVENKDRLCRFGFELLEKLFLKYGTKIIVTSEVQNKTYEQ